MAKRTSRPATVKSRDDVLARLAAQRAAVEALEEAAGLDLTAEREALARTERDEDAARRRAARAEEELRRAVEASRSAREAIRRRLAPFVERGASAAAIAALHGVPASLVVPRSAEASEPDATSGPDAPSGASETPEPIEPARDAGPFDASEKVEAGVPGWAGE
jgi:hypothetical protein